MLRHRYLLIAVMALVLAIGLPACAPDEAAPPSGETPAPEEEEEEESTPAAAEVETFKWSLQGSTAGVGDLAFRNEQRISDRITLASGGRITVEPFGSGAIVQGNKELEGLDSGSIEAAVTEMTWGESWIPAAPLFTQVSGGMPANQVLDWYLAGGGDELCAEVFESQLNLKYIGPLVEGPEVWCHSTAVLETVDDLRGLKMRSAGDGGQVLARMGVGVVQFPSTELYEAIQRGVVDMGESGGIGVNWGRGFHEVADYLYTSPTRAPHDVRALWVNRDAWEALTPDLQEIVTMAVHDEAKQWLAEQVILDAEVVALYADYGTIIAPLPQVIVNAYIAEARLFYAERAANDPLAARILESKQQFQDWAASASVFYCN